MKTLAIVVAVIALIALSVYVVMFLCFVGGIEQIVVGSQSTPTDGGDIAWGIVRVVIAIPVGWLCLAADITAICLLVVWKDD